MGKLRDARGSAQRTPEVKTVKDKAHKGTRILYTAIVIDVFSNPQALSDQQKNIFKQGMTHGVSNASLVDSMPRNSIAAILVDDVGAREFGVESV